MASEGVGGCGAAGATPYTARQRMLCERSNIKQLMQQVYDFQTEAFGDKISTNWKVGTFYTGVYAAYEATGESAFYEGAKAWCESAGWKVSAILGGSFHADSICTAQTYLDIYMKEREPFMIADIQANLEKYFGKKTVTYQEMGHARWKDEARPFVGRNLWWWADSLYMAPPVLTRLYAATGEQRYLDLLHQLFWDSVDFLYCEEDGLFLRDELYFDKKTPGGNPVFWGRGNGWVYAGLMRALPYIPDSDPQKEKYIRLFMDLTRAVVKYQQPDGLWRSSLNEPSWKPYPETSASSFFCYGLLAGINNGYLEAKIWLPVALRAWEGLLNCINPEGRLGFAQLVAEAPGFTCAQDSVDYTHGAFLLAASELYKMNLGAEGFNAVTPSEQIETIARNASWSDCGDEQIVTDENFLHCGVVGADGTPRVDLYSRREVWSPFIYQQYFLPEAEGAPVLLTLQNGKLLAAYIKKEEPGRWVFKTADYIASEFNVSWTLEWGPEQCVQAFAGQPCCNLIQLSEENGRVCNLYADGAALYVQSSDDLQTWDAPVELIASEGTLSFKWASDAKSRIDILLAEQSGDALNVFHMGYTDGTWSSPAMPVYVGKVPEDGWFADLQYDETGDLSALFTVAQADGKTAVLRATRNAGNEWATELVATAGKIGGVCMGTCNPSAIYLSADSDPATGLPEQSGPCQIFRRINNAWDQLTFDASADNLRPAVPRGHGRAGCVAWVRKAEGIEAEVVGVSAREAGLPSGMIA